MTDSERWICIAEGDDGIARDGWAALMATYKHLLSLHNNCDSFAFELPLDELSDYLQSCGVSALFDEVAFDSTHGMLEQLLAPHARVEYESWDADAPGCSGVYVRVFIDEAALPQVCAILDKSEAFIARWMDESGLSAAIRHYEEAENIARMNAVRAAALEKADRERKDQDEVDAWEQKLLAEVLGARQSQHAQPYCRLNFLVANDAIFFLDTGWWHSLKGDPRNVALHLERQGIDVVRCKVVISKKGWIPYFGRTAQEQRGLGWDDETLLPEALSPEMNQSMMSAWNAYKVKAKQGD
jgi:hypothetical protein